MMLLESRVLAATANVRQNSYIFQRYFLITLVIHKCCLQKWQQLESIFIILASLSVKLFSLTLSCWLICVVLNTSSCSLLWLVALALVLIGRLRSWPRLLYEEAPWLVFRTYICLDVALIYRQRLSVTMLSEKECSGVLPNPPFINCDADCRIPVCNQQIADLKLCWILENLQTFLK